MVKIYKGTKTKVVTKGAFYEMFEKDGWQIGDPAVENTESVEIPIEEVKTPANVAQEPEPLDYEEEPEEDDEVEIPLSEMTVSQLKAYARERDIDISSAKNKRELRAIIAAEMEE